jgi:hypothetical protein
MSVTVSAISNGSSVSSIHVRPFLSIVFLLTTYKNGEGRALLEGQHLSHELQTTHSRPIFLWAQREWESKPPKLPSAEIHLHGCVGDQIFGERLRDCSHDLFIPVLHLHPAVRRLSGATSAAVILHDDRSRDCTAYIFLHRLRTATSNKHTRCLVWMESLMPWASVPPQCTLCSLYLYMFRCCLLLMQVVIHTCTYMSSHISHYFSGLN